jgi:cytosine/adenosine deaminase-related metal-dependent hydrolase
MNRAFVNGTVMTCDEAFNVHSNGTVCVDGSTITYVGQTPPSEFAPDEVVDCSGWILMPGIINAHVHLGEHLFRGWMDEMEFEGLFYSTLFRWEGNLTPEDVLVGSLAAAVECVKSGVTTVSDMYHHADRIAEAVSEVGLRAMIGQKVLGFSLDAPPQLSGGEVDYRLDPIAFRKQMDVALDFAERWNGAANGHIRTALCPHATNTLDANMLAEVARQSLGNDLPIHMHLAQMASEQNTVRKRDGLGCVELLERCGVLEARFLGAHGIFVSKDELRLLTRHTASIVHNPIANAKDAGLIAPINGYQQAGVRIALGTDAFRMDLLEAARFAAYIHRTVAEDGTAFPAREVLHWATLGGAEALGWSDRIGSLEAGKAADMIAVDASRLESLANGDPHACILYYGSPQLIRRVYIDGRLICRDGELVTVREQDVSRDLAARQQAAKEREGIS